MKHDNCELGQTGIEPLAPPMANGTVGVKSGELNLGQIHPSEMGDNESIEEPSAQTNETFVIFFF